MMTTSYRRSPDQKAEATYQRLSLMRFTQCQQKTEDGWGPDVSLSPHVHCHGYLGKKGWEKHWIWLDFPERDKNSKSDETYIYIYIFFCVWYLNSGPYSWLGRSSTTWAILPFLKHILNVDIYWKLMTAIFLIMELTPPT